MRPSLYQHNIARLRDITGSKQRAFAEEVGITLTVLRNIESDRTKLSDEVGVRIASSTGVSLAWLLQNDLRAPAVAVDGSPYTKRHFEIVQALKDVHQDYKYPAGWNGDAHFLAYADRLLAVLWGITHHHPNEGEVIYWRVEKFLAQLEADFTSMFAGNHRYRQPDAGEIVAPGITKGQVETGINRISYLIKLYHHPEIVERKQTVQAQAEELLAAPDFMQRIETYKRTGKRHLLGPPDAPHKVTVAEREGRERSASWKEKPKPNSLTDELA